MLTYAHTSVFSESTGALNKTRQYFRGLHHWYSCFESWSGNARAHTHTHRFSAFSCDYSEINSMKRSLLERLILRNSPPSTEHRGSLPCSQKPASGPYPVPDESRTYLSSYFLKTQFNIILPPTTKHYKWAPSLQFSYQRYCYMHATFPVHLNH